MLLAALLVLNQPSFVPLWPGAVSTSEVAYLPAREGGIQAVRLADGKRIWITHEAEWPLEVTADELVAAGHPSSSKPNDLEIVFLRPSDATVLARSTQSLPLPSGITARPSYDDPNEFMIERRINEAGTVLIYWHAIRTVQIGIAKNPALPQRQPIEAYGGLVIDPHSAALIATVPGNRDIVGFPKGTFADPLDKSRTILWPPAATDDLRIYPAEKTNIRDFSGGGREVWAVAVDASTGQMRWQIPIAVRHVERLKM